MIKKVLSICLLLSLAPSCFSLKAYRLGSYDKAFEQLQISKDKVADYYLGKMYLYGYGQLRNTTVALRYITKAAQKNYLPAQLFLGSHYLQIDPKQSFVWYKKAADQGNAAAQVYVVGAYIFGFGVRKDLEKARPYYIKAARNSNTLGQITLAEHFLASSSRHNRRLGINWLNKAIDENDPKAQYTLGTLYIKGREVKKDPKLAKAWLNKASQQNYAPAKIALARLFIKQQELTKAQKILSDNNPEALYLQGEIFQKEDNPQAAFLKTLQAAIKGYRPAQLRVADFYKKGIGTEVSEHLSLEWLNKPQINNKQRALARWLSNDKNNNFDFGIYKERGILSSWHNKNSLQPLVYNSSPKMADIARSKIFKPKFAIVKPRNVPLNDYFKVLLEHEYLKPLAKNSQWPSYKLYKHLEAEINNDSFIMRAHEFNLPYQEIYYLGEKKANPFELLYSWLPKPQNKENFLAIFNQLYNRAILGNIRAQFAIGQMFEYGLGVSKNDTQAITFFEKAARQQYLPAQYSMAVLYLNSQNPKKQKTGRAWMEDAAFKGSAYAQYVMSKLEADNSFLYLSAGNNYGQAQLELANYLTFEKNINFFNNNSVTYKLYEKAFAQGYIDALLPLAYYNTLQKDHSMALQYALKAYENQPKAASLLLGLIYDRGIGVKQDPKKALKWYKLSGDNIITEFVIGTNLALGQGFDKNISLAKKFLTRSANSNFSYSNLNLAIINYQQGAPFLTSLNKAYNLGNNTAGLLLADYSLQKMSLQNLHLAHEIYQNLANKGDAQAQLKLAYMFENGIGVKTDFAQAAKFYQRAAKNNNKLAQFYLGRFYQLGLLDTPDYKKSLYWYKKAAQKYPEAYNNMGFIAETVFDNYQEAQNFYSLAKLPQSFYNLGLIKEYGKGCAVDTNSARSYFKQAALQNYAPAMSQLAQAYLKDTPSQPQTAQKWFLKAASLHNTQAIYQLGLLAETGIATAINYKKAYIYYKLAARAGNQEAAIALARMYQYGIGIPKNIDKAKDIYKKLAQYNNSYAQLKLANLMIDDPKLATKLLHQATNNGNAYAKLRLQILKAQSDKTVSFVNPIVINNLDTRSQSVGMLYYDALAKWSNNEISARYTLEQLMVRYPNYTPVKKILMRLNTKPGLHIHG